MFSKSKYRYGKVKMNFILPFGKYKFMTIKEVYNYDPQYLGWAQAHLIFKLPWRISKECEQLYEDSRFAIALFIDEFDDWFWGGGMFND